MRCDIVHERDGRRWHMQVNSCRTAMRAAESGGAGPPSLLLLDERLDALLRE
jgi:hypothetical protein